MDNNPLVIDYYSDVLCIWAWISQRRLGELKDEWGSHVELRFHQINIFGDVEHRMATQWSQKGGYEGFARHVLESAAPYDNAPVNDNVWQDIRPRTSLNAHLVIKAVQIMEGQERSSDLSFLFQKCFFVDNIDIGLMPVLLDIARDQGFDIKNIQALIESGEAGAVLMNDYQKSKDLQIKGSPTYIMNNGRQVLFGNVGYRILRANIKEILSNPEHEASWC